MEQENITFHEYLLTKRGKEVHLSSDLCFKYAMQDQKVASLVLNTLGFTVRPEDITIRSEIGTGIHIRCTGEHRFDMEILDFQSQTTYDFELQNYKENISFKMTIKLLERIISDFDIKKNEVKDIDDLPITHLIVLDNYTKNLNYNYEEIAIMKKLEDTFKEYYKGKIMIHHLQCNVKNDKMKLGKERFEGYKKFLKCFDKDSEELKKDGDLLMRMLGKQVEAFNSDEVKRREAFEAEWKQINERWVKAQNEKELQAQKELLSKKDEQILNQQELLSQKDTQLSQKDEQITNQQSQLLSQQEKVVSYAKLLKSLGKTTLEIKEATGLSVDEIEKM